MCYLYEYIAGACEKNSVSENAVKKSPAFKVWRRKVLQKKCGEEKSCNKSAVKKSPATKVPMKKNPATKVRRRKVLQKGEDSTALGLVREKIHGHFDSRNFLHGTFVAGLFFIGIFDAGLFSTEFSEKNGFHRHRQSIN